MLYVKSFTSNDCCVKTSGECKTCLELYNFHNSVTNWNVKKVSVDTCVLQKCFRYRRISLEVFKKYSKCYSFFFTTVFSIPVNGKCTKAVAQTKNLGAILIPLLTPNFKSISKFGQLYLQSVFRIQPLLNVCITATLFQDIHPAPLSQHSPTPFCYQHSSPTAPVEREILSRQFTC